MPISASEPLLDVTELSAGYGKIGVLTKIGLQIGTGEIVALLGPNGAGKTTLLRAISGLLGQRTGRIVFNGRDISGTGPREAVHAGIAHVIEGHRIFTQLTITDNLLLAGYDLPRGERAARVEEALSSFPELVARRAQRGGSLSGGQQQMLAVAQGLVRRPRLLLLDEPSAGLSPVLVDRVLSVAHQLRQNGVSILLVEQLVDKALALANRVYALARGRIVLAAPATDNDLRQRLERAYFGDAVRPDQGK